MAWKKNSLAAVFFFVATAWLTWPLLARMGTGLNTSADPLLNYWALSWNFHILPQEPFSFFDANIFFPREDTLAYSEHLFGVALIAWPAYLLSGSSLFAYNFAFAASFVLSGLGMYLLVVELSGSRWAGLFSGIVYLAAPYRFLHILHIQTLSAQWFPFAFLYLYRFLRDQKPRQLAAFCLFALLQILSCNYYAVYLALALALFALVLVAFSFRTRSLLSAKKAVLLLAGAATVAALALPFALPYERNRERGFYRRYEDVVQFSAQPLDYLRPSSFNKVFYAEVLPQQQRSEKVLFPGFAVLALAGLGLFFGRRIESENEEAFPEGRRMIWAFFILLIGVAFVLSLGPVIEVGGQTYGMPYRFLYRHVPGFNGMRAPARLGILVLMGLAALSGLGISWLLKKLESYKTWVGVALIGIALFEYQTYPLNRALAPAPRTPPVYGWLANQSGSFGVLELPIYEDITREAIRMYYSTAHWKHLANGFSGWWPNDYWVLVGRMRHFPTYRILQFLEREAPVRYILIHYDKYPEGRREKLRQDMIRYRDRMPLRARFGEDAVHELLPERETR